MFSWFYWSVVSPLIERCFILLGKFGEGDLSLFSLCIRVKSLGTLPLFYPCVEVRDPFFVAPNSYCLIFSPSMKESF